MAETLFSQLIATTFSREAALRRAALIQSTLEATVYESSETPLGERYRGALAAEVSDPTDRAALAALGTGWLSTVTTTSVQAVGDALQRAIKAAPTRMLYVPVLLDEAGERVVGQLLRTQLNEPELLVDYELDDTLTVGCRVVHGGRLYDYSFRTLAATNPHRVRDILHTYAHAGSA